MQQVRRSYSLTDMTLRDLSQNKFTDVTEEMDEGESVRYLRFTIDFIAIRSEVFCSFRHSYAFNSHYFESDRDDNAKINEKSGKFKLLVLPYENFLKIF